MRESGVLLHVTSLPGKEGVGTLGKAAYSWIDFLSESGCTIWQMLPVGPTGFGDSPYQSPSAFAGNPLLIDLETLMDEGLLEHGSLDAGQDMDKVDFQAVAAEKERLLRLSFDAHYQDVKSAVSAFAAQNAWASQYAAYQTLIERYGAYQNWPLNARAFCKKPDAEIADYLEKQRERVAYYLYQQYLFDKQWKNLKAYAAKKHIQLLGDMPIYAAPGSADVWAHPDMFQLDEQYNSTRVAGVPPDYFSADGQLWGNPLYNWKALRRDHYKWWIDRLRMMGQRFDIVRIDHFIGFANYYSIPADAKTARIGKWVINRGKAFFRVVKKELPSLDIIAEDLGAVNARVRRLIDFCGYPGMKVLEFAFGSDDTNQHLPKNILKHAVVYTATHDNDTVLGWWNKVDAREKARVVSVLNMHPGDEICDAVVRAALACEAERAIIPIQDLLSLPDSARMNIPGTVGGDNWRYRMRASQMEDPALLRRLRLLNREYKRGAFAKESLI